MIRDASAGERAIKDQRSTYLPMLEEMEADEYAAYLDRATFYNFTGRTVGALTGSIFRRREVFENLPPHLTTRLDTISRKRESFSVFAEFIASEIVKMGRVGVLIDLPREETSTPRPYFAHYPAETIVDWDTTEIDGREHLSFVALSELKLVRDTKDLRPKYITQYRVLRLEQQDGGWVYVQELYSHPEQDVPSLTPEYRTDRFTPLNRGRPLPYIPFRIFGAFMSTPEVEKPPIEDIAQLNLSHYRSYAYLEHGRFFAGFPIYYIEAGMQGENGGSDYTIGASRVWVAPSGTKPGILELNGQGLKFLADALDQKESQAAALGGRMMGVRTTAVAESDNMLRLSERNEQSQLLKVTKSLDAGFTQLLRWWAELQDVPAETSDRISVEFNKDFLFDGISAREFRAVHAMYKDGVLPIDVVFYYFKKGNLIPDWMDLKEFKRLLDKMDSFPNNPDVEARKDGFKDSQARQQAEQNALNREAEMDLLETELEAEATEADKGRRAAERMAARNREATPGDNPSPINRNAGRGGQSS